MFLDSMSVGKVHYLRALAVVAVLTAIAAVLSRVA